MALPNPSLVQVCRSVAEFLQASVRDKIIDDSLQVLLGNPAALTPQDKHCVNMFFYQFEPSGFYADTKSNEPWWLRIRCLITPFSYSSEVNTKGEKDLQLLGEIMRIFHEKPVLETVSLINDEETKVGKVRLQVVLIPLTLNDINQLWGTQHEISYRPSVAYEMALTPVIPDKLAAPAPRVETAELKNIELITDE